MLPRRFDRRCRRFPSERRGVGEHLDHPSYHWPMIGLQPTLHYGASRRIPRAGVAGGQRGRRTLKATALSENRITYSSYRIRAYARARLYPALAWTPFKISSSSLSPSLFLSPQDRIHSLGETLFRCVSPLTQINSALNVRGGFRSRGEKKQPGDLLRNSRT